MIAGLRPAATAIIGRPGIAAVLDHDPGHRRVDLAWMTGCLFASAFAGGGWLALPHHHVWTPLFCGSTVLGLVFAVAFLLPVLVIAPTAHDGQLRGIAAHLDLDTEQLIDALACAWVLRRTVIVGPYRAYWGRNAPGGRHLVVEMRPEPEAARHQPVTSPLPLLAVG